MNKLTNALEKGLNKTALTENGALTNASSLDACLDFFFVGPVAKKNPSDPDAAEFMMAAYQNKVNLLNAVAEAHL